MDSYSLTKIQARYEAATTDFNAEEKGSDTATTFDNTHPPGKKSHCVEQLKKTTAQLMEKFPAVFEEARSKPLKIGILEEVMARGPRMSKKHARLSLAYYTRHLNYQRALLAATHRYDLDGHPCGEVTEAQKEAAKRHIKRVYEHWKKRKQQKKKQRAVKQADTKSPWP